MKITLEKLTQKYLKECVDYNAETGIFVWRHRPRRHFETYLAYSSVNSRQRGKVAGKINTVGYAEICIKNKYYKAHRLAWLYVYGYLPENEIDHKDRDTTNNKIKNLREVSHRCNMRNKKVSKKNKSGVTGVCYHKESKGWTSSIGVDYRPIYLGGYKEKDDAVRARWEAEKKHGFPDCNTTSSAYLYLKEKSLI